MVTANLCWYDCVTRQHERKSAVINIYNENLDGMKNVYITCNASSPKTDDEMASDCCDNEDISAHFTSKCRMLGEEVVHANNTYILHMSGLRGSTCPNVMLGLSNNTSVVYKIDNHRIDKLETFEVDDCVVDVKASPDSNSLFYVGAKNCEVSLWDIRAPHTPSSVFKDESILEDDGKFKPMTCFDVSPNNRLLAAGTEVHEGDSFILFWDVRNVKMLGGYWESHMEDITQVRFHPSDVNKLISSSTDGLINVYDLSQTSEDDALVDCLNTESSIDRLFWYKQGNADFICSTFHTNDLQLWKGDGVQPHAYFSREDLTRHIRHERSSDSTYIANAHTTDSDGLFLLVGSTAEDGKCLRSLQVNKTGLNPLCDFNGNRQIVRSSWYSNQANIVVTGGEKGVMNVWEVDRYT